MKAEKITFRKNYESTDEFAGLDCKDPSRTLQSEAESCDINYILKRVEQGGTIETKGGAPRYGDFSQFGDPADYIQNLTHVAAAQDAFSQLPAALRSRFGNDPAQLLAFVDDASNRPEAEKLGLVKKQPEKKPASPDSPPKKPSGSTEGSSEG